MRWTLGVVSEMRVAGYDPEYADMSNPQGAVVHEVFTLLAESAKGYRRAWGSFWTAAEAEARLPYAPPVDMWPKVAPAYGSEAYVAEGIEADVAEWERANDGPVYGLRATATLGYERRAW